MSRQKLFEVGDKVRSCRWHGVLEIAKIVLASPSPVVVYDAAGDAHTFTIDGKQLTNDIDPSLYHAETGSPCRVGVPPERFEYPLYVTNGCYIVEFTGLNFGTVRANDNGIWNIGHSTDIWTRHTNRDIWTPCEKPAWKPTKPTWCWVWDDYRADAVRRLVRHSNLGDMNDLYYVIPGDYQTYYKHAEPCGQEQIPDYWPEEWV